MKEHENVKRPYMLCNPTCTAIAVAQEDDTQAVINIKQTLQLDAHLIIGYCVASYNKMSVIERWRANPTVRSVPVLVPRKREMILIIV